MQADLTDADFGGAILKMVNFKSATCPPYTSLSFSHNSSFLKGELLWTC